MNSGNWRLIQNDVGQWVIFDIDRRDPNNTDRLKPIVTIHDSAVAKLLLHAREMERATDRLWKATEHTHPQLSYFESIEPLPDEPNYSAKYADWQRRKAAAAAAEKELNAARDVAYQVILSVK